MIGAVVLPSLALSVSSPSAGEVPSAPLTVRLEYAAAAGCPDAADFRAVVVARLGYDPFADVAPDHVLVRIEARGGAVDGRIEWRDASDRWTGEQTFPSPSTDCPRLVRTMGFALAVQIQLLAKATADQAGRSAAAEAGPPSDGPRTTNADQRIPTPPPPPPVASAVVVAPVSAGGPRATLALGAGPAVGFGMSSAPVVLGRLFGVIAWPHAALELAVVASLPDTTRRADGAGVSQQHLLGSAAACATTVRWKGCALVNAGAVRMAGENIDRPTSATVPIVEAGVRAVLDQRLGRRAVVGAHADGLVNVTRWTGRLDQVPVWTAPRFAAALGVDASVEFP